MGAVPEAACHAWPQAHPHPLGTLPEGSGSLVALQGAGQKPEHSLVATADLSWPSPGLTHNRHRVPPQSLCSAVLGFTSSLGSRGQASSGTQPAPWVPQHTRPEPALAPSHPRAGLGRPTSHTSCRRSTAETRGLSWLPSPHPAGSHISLGEKLGTDWHQGPVSADLRANPDHAAVLSLKDG